MVDADFFTLFALNQEERIYICGIMTTNEAPISAFSRLRTTTDGEGITTLVAFMLCPLHCRWCLNPQTLSLDHPHALYTPQTLYEAVRKDELYFLATGGGITFGGGEPLLRADFIREFRAICGEEWKINVETSLNVPSTCLIDVMEVVDSYIIDVKDMNPDIYLRYTSHSNEQVVINLRQLAERGLASRCRIRLPLIPQYNTPSDRFVSRQQLEEMGFSDIDEFTYKTTNLWKEEKKSARC